MTIDARQSLASAISLAADFLAEREVKTIDQIVTGYANRLTTFVKTAMKDGDYIAMRRAHKQLIKNVARDVYRDGLREGGIEPKDETPEDKAATDEVIDTWIADQSAYIDQFAKDAAAVAKDKTLKDGILSRIDTWVSSLQNFGEAGKLAALGNIPLTLDGEDGNESCDECQKYKGVRHRRNWWAERDLLRRNGNENYTCGRWDNCQHYFRDDKGNVVIS